MTCKRTLHRLLIDFPTNNILMIRIFLLFRYASGATKIPRRMPLQPLLHCARLLPPRFTQTLSHRHGPHRGRCKPEHRRMPRYGTAGAEGLLGIQGPRHGSSARASSVVPRSDGRPCHSRERQRWHGRSLRFHCVADVISLGQENNGRGVRPTHNVRMKRITLRANWASQLVTQNTATGGTAGPLISV